MEGIKSKIRLFILAFLCWVIAPASGSTETVSIEMAEGQAEVVWMRGKAALVTKELQTIKALSLGDLLSQGDRIKTEKRARLELKLPDGSFIRFDDNTTFRLATVAFNPQKNEPDIKVNILLGKTWAKVAKLQTAKGRFAITTKTAVAGVRGTTFRVNVNADNSAVIKVYWGEILVERLKKEKSDQVASKKESTQRVVVSGPEPVAGPKVVSMEEWTYLVKSLQQININPDGTAAPPFRFDIAADQNDWVRWNQERDKVLEGE